jgi:ATP-dependent DNA helicase PIF1
VLCGDFCQLPPVKLGQLPGVCFAFEAACWEGLLGEAFVLRTAYRQHDAAFLALLEEVRHGCEGAVGGRGQRGGLSGPSVALLKQAGRRVLDVGDGVKPTRLYATNRRVDALNEAELAKLQGEPRSFAATDWGPSEPALRQLVAHCLAPTVLTLKVGAQVLLLKNLDVTSGTPSVRTSISTNLDPY